MPVPEPRLPDRAPTRAGDAVVPAPSIPRLIGLALLAPLLWGGVGLGVISVLHRPLAIRAARYAALVSFFAVPIMLAPGAFIVLMLRVRRLWPAVPTLVVLLLVGAFSTAGLAGILRGREWVLDARNDGLLLNGRRLAPLSAVARFDAWVRHPSASKREQVDVLAVLRDGTSLRLDVPDSAYMEVLVAPLNDLLGAVRGTPAARPALACAVPAPGCPGWQDAPQQVRGTVGAALGAQPPARAP